MMQIPKGYGDAIVDREIAPIDCPVCAQLNPTELEDLARSWNAGLERHRLLKLFPAVTPQGLETHVIRCLYNTYKSRYARSAKAFDRLWEAIDIAHHAYKQDPCQYNATSYAVLAKQMRQILIDLENLKNAADQAEELVACALNPMVKSFTHSLVSESGSLKEDLLAKFTEEDADKIVGDYLKRLGTHLKTATEAARDRIEEVLDAKDKKRSVPKGRGASASNATKVHGNLKAVG